MTGNLKYQAYQTAYIGDGFVIQTYVLTIITVLLTYLIILPLKIPIVFIEEWIINKLAICWESRVDYESIKNIMNKSVSENSMELNIF